jgi:hypothetical protein
MKTPREYNTKSLKNGIVTKTMLSDCLYSVNKRAKNYRDRVREERDYQRRCHYRCMYDNTESLFEKFVRKVIAALTYGTAHVVDGESENAPSERHASEQSDG